MVPDHSAALMSFRRRHPPKFAETLRALSPIIKEQQILQVTSQTLCDLNSHDNATFTPQSEVGDLGALGTPCHSVRPSGAARQIRMEARIAACSVSGQLEAVQRW
ncbi:hypothetical protein MesoLj113b_68710 (plasmid) [Mesorhizobium sp. 113-3-3]|nr:hypothetical protein MesoLj113b_68710 [Mesorhizobium sp. 113-3-3]